MGNPVLYIILNGELNMSAGKGAAQAVHAAMGLDNYGKPFGTHHKRTVIILEAKNSEQLKNLHEYCQGQMLQAQYYIDEGVNEVDAYSVTALAVAPIDNDDEERRAMFESFPLFRGHEAVRKSRWFGRVI